MVPFLCLDSARASEAHRPAPSHLQQISLLSKCWASHVALVVKNTPVNARGVRDSRLIPGWGRSPGGGHGNPLQYSCLKNPIDRGAWRATVHGVTKFWTRLK